MKTTQNAHFRASALLGKEVNTSTGEKLGQIKDLLFYQDSAEIALIIQHGKLVFGSIGIVYSIPI